MLFQKVQGQNVCLQALYGPTCNCCQLARMDVVAWKIFLPAGFSVYNDNVFHLFLERFVPLTICPGVAPVCCPC